MNCMKCGREIEAEQVFCDDCLVQMSQHPVDPDIRVQIPDRREVPAIKKPVKHRGASPEEQITVLKKRLRLLMILLILSWIAAAAMAYPAAKYLMEDHFAPGQNYSTVTMPAANTAAP